MRGACGATLHGFSRSSARSTSNMPGAARSATPCTTCRRSAKCSPACGLQAASAGMASTPRAMAGQLIGARDRRGRARPGGCLRRSSWSGPAARRFAPCAQAVYLGCATAGGHARRLVAAARALAPAQRSTGADASRETGVRPTAGVERAASARDQGAARARQAREAAASMLAVPAPVEQTAERKTVVGRVSGPRAAP